MAIPPFTRPPSAVHRPGSTQSPVLHPHQQPVPHILRLSSQAIGAASPVVNAKRVKDVPSLSRPSATTGKTTTSNSNASSTAHPSRPSTSTAPPAMPTQNSVPSSSLVPGPIASSAAEAILTTSKSSRGKHELIASMLTAIQSACTQLQRICPELASLKQGYEEQRAMTAEKERQRKEDQVQYKADIQAILQDMEEKVQSRLEGVRESVEDKIRSAERRAESDNNLVGRLLVDLKLDLSRLPEVTTQQVQAAIESCLTSNDLQARQEELCSKVAQICELAQSGTPSDERLAALDKRLDRFEALETDLRVLTQTVSSMHEAVQTWSAIAPILLRLLQPDARSCPIGPHMTKLLQNSTLSAPNQLFADLCGDSSLQAIANARQGDEMVGNEPSCLPTPPASQAAPTRGVSEEGRIPDAVTDDLSEATLQNSSEEPLSDTRPPNSVEAESATLAFTGEGNSSSAKSKEEERAGIPREDQRQRLKKRKRYIEVPPSPTMDYDLDRPAVEEPSSTFVDVGEEAATSSFVRDASVAASMPGIETSPGSGTHPSHVSTDLASVMTTTLAAEQDSLNSIPPVIDRPTIDCRITAPHGQMPEPAVPFPSIIPSTSHAQPTSQDTGRPQTLAKRIAASTMRTLQNTAADSQRLSQNRLTQLTLLSASPAAPRFFLSTEGAVAKQVALASAEEAPVHQKPARRPRSRRTLRCDSSSSDLADDARQASPAPPSMLIQAARAGSTDSGIREAPGARQDSDPASARPAGAVTTTDTGPVLGLLTKPDIRARPAKKKRRIELDVDSDCS